MCDGGFMEVGERSVLGGQSAAGGLPARAAG